MAKPGVVEVAKPGAAEVAKPAAAEVAKPAAAAAKRLVVGLRLASTVGAAESTVGAEAARKVPADGPARRATLPEVAGPTTLRPNKAPLRSSACFCVRALSEQPSRLCITHHANKECSALWFAHSNEICMI